MTDFFISYTRVDRPWAEWIAWVLEEAGYTTIVQAWDFRPGSNFVQSMDDATQQGQRTLAVLSPDYFNSLFTQSEWQSAFRQDPTSAEGKLLPVRVRECDPEGLLGSIVYIDLVGLSAVDAKAVLTTGAQNERLKPKNEPPFPGKPADTSSQRQEPRFPSTQYAQQAEETPRSSTPLGKLINVPNLPAHYVMRPEALQAAKTLVLMSRQQPVAVTGTSHHVGLQGMGGIGKSVLAAALTTDDAIRAKFPDGLIWLPLGQTPKIVERQIQLSNFLSNKTEEFMDEEQGKARLSELLSDKACLIILDDVWQMAHLRAFDALGSHSCLLMTTRDLNLVTALGASEYRLDILSEDQALELLAQWAVVYPAATDNSRVSRSGKIALFHHHERGHRHGAGRVLLSTPAGCSGGGLSHHPCLVARSSQGHTATTCSTR